jgi:hypothetical protein
MQNAPTMLGQKMMSRQAPYGPIGMVAQDMSGNKKGARGGVIKLTFNTTNATSGTTFSNSDTTFNNATGLLASAKSLYPKNTGNWYVEFTLSGGVNQYVGLIPDTFICNTLNNISTASNGISYNPNNGLFNDGGAVATSTTGDVIGIAYTAPMANGSYVYYYKNGVLLYSYLCSGFTNTSYVAACTLPSTALSITISNNIYSAPATYTPLRA